MGINVLVIKHRAFLKKIRINSAVMGCNNYNAVLSREKDGL
jgi:hypothetical protein